MVTNVMTDAQDSQFECPCSFKIGPPVDCRHLSCAQRAQGQGVKKCACVWCVCVCVCVCGVTARADHWCSMLDHIVGRVGWGELYIGNDSQRYRCDE